MNSSVHYVSSEGGIFSGHGVLGSSLALFLIQSTLILAISRLFHFFLNKLRQPRVISEIIGGICLGPSVLGLIPKFTDTIFPPSSLPILSLVANFGLVLYMFIMGLELDTNMLFGGVRRFMSISIAGILLPGALGAAVSYGLYAVLLEEAKRQVTPFLSFVIFTFVAMAITAFPVLARILTEKKLLGTTVGLITISAAAIDDICAWILLALVVSIINAATPLTALYVLIVVAGYAILLLVPIRILLRKVFEKFIGKRKNALSPFILAVIFVMIFVSAWMTEWIGVHAIFGAFLAGIIMPRMGNVTVDLTHKLEDLVSVCLLPLYFASSGLKTKLGLLDTWQTWVFLLLVILVACVGKIMGCTIAAKISGFSWREAFSIGVLMNTKGLVELIVLNIGLDAGVINERIFVIMVVMALVTTFMSSPIISFLYPPRYQKSVSSTRKVSPAGLDKIDCDDRILVYLKDIDSIPMVSNILKLFHASLFDGKQLYLNGMRTLSDADSSTSVMASTQKDSMISHDTTLKMFQIFGQMLGVPTKGHMATTRYSEIGEEVEKVVSKENCNMVIVSRQADVMGVEQQETIVNILESVHVATCVYIDRYNPLSHQTSGGILIPFIGGQNDRAALSLAFRLTQRPQTPLTVLHLIIPDRLAEKEDEEMLKFAKELAKDGLVTIKTETLASDSMQLDLDLWKESNFNLVVLGYNRKMVASQSKYVHDHMADVKNRPNLVKRSLTSASNSLKSLQNSTKTALMHISNLVRSLAGQTTSVFRKFSRKSNISHVHIDPEHGNKIAVNFPSQTAQQKRLNFIKRFSQEASDELEEKILGQLGMMLNSIAWMPSILIVHEPKSVFIGEG